MVLISGCSSGIEFNKLGGFDTLLPKSLHIAPFAPGFLNMLSPIPVASVAEQVMEMKMPFMMVLIFSAGWLVIGSQIQ